MDYTSFDSNEENGSLEPPSRFHRGKMTFLRHGILVTLIQRKHVLMKNLFDATVANQVKIRLGKLEP